jgi:nucleoside-diphosphate-sugar epimerase
MKCGRGPGKRGSLKLDICAAAKEMRLHNVHEGKNSGRACWVVAGTYCGGTLQGTFAKKHLACKRCDFYNKVQREEGGKLEKNHSLLNRLKVSGRRVDITTKKLGILIGGSGLIGGALMHYFKTKTSGNIEVLSPNSKKISLREPRDIYQYFMKYQPDFIVNCAITSLDSDAQLSYEINFLGPIKLAKMALALKIPYIHFTSAATLPCGENLSEEDQLPLHPEMANYPKSKLMAEKILRSMHENQGLDYTVIRLAVVYGKHDHKIQGFHRLLFSIADQSMPFIFSKPGIFHSYSHAKKVPHFVDHILEHREEFSGQTYNFVDREPVEMVSLIRAIKKHLNVSTPRNIFIPYFLARLNKNCIWWIVRKLGRIGVDIRLPAELIFLENCYKTQTLSSAKLDRSSYKGPMADVTVYTKLPAMIDYYITRWRHLSLLTTTDKEYQDPEKPAGEFLNSPETLLEKVNESQHLSIDEFEKRF